MDPWEPELAEELPIEPIDEPWVYLSKKVVGSSKNREKYAYGFAAAAVGFVAMGAYLYTQKKQKKVSNNERKETLLDNADTEFQMV